MVLTALQRALAAACVVAFGATALPAAAQPKPLTLRYTTGAPAKTPWVTQLERFAKDVEEESNGSIKIDQFIAAQLGNEQDTAQQVARGRIDMGGFSSGAVALLVPEFGLFALPFYFQSAAEQDCTLDTEPVTKFVADSLAKKGVQFLGWTEVGTVDLMSKRVFNHPKEVNGLKAAAAAHKVNSMMWQALGANPTFVGITEITSAFQTGLVDVTATVITFYLPSGLNKVAPVANRIAISDSPGIIMMNKRTYDSMPKEQQAALMRGVQRRSADLLRKEIRGFEETLYGLHVKGGGQMITPTSEQRGEWRKALVNEWPKMVKELGGESEKFFALLEAGRKVCDKK
jgi:TRAP-type C4-dicarboxylate transport system substrate-binding protein